MKTETNTQEVNCNIKPEDLNNFFRQMMADLKKDYESVKDIKVSVQTIDTIPVGFICYSKTVLENYQLCDGSLAKGKLSEIMTNVPDLLTYLKIGSRLSELIESNNKRFNLSGTIKEYTTTVWYKSLDRKITYKRNDSQNTRNNRSVSWRPVEDHYHEKYINLPDNISSDEWRPETYTLLPLIKYK